MANDVTYISFNAEINQTTTETLLGVCADLANKKVGTVYLLFSTLGGNVINGFTLYNVLKGMPFKLITHNVGSVNSIGNVVFSSGTERYSCSNATFMFHGVGFDITSPTRLEEKSLRERLDSISADQKRIGRVLSENTNLCAQDIDALFLEQVTKDPDYAKGVGLIHDIKEVNIPSGAPLIQLVFKR